MLVTEEIGNGPLADLIKHIQAGNEVLLTQGSQPVAKIISISEKQVFPKSALEIRSIKGHRALTTNPSQAELADEMFGQK